MPAIVSGSRDPASKMCPWPYVHGYNSEMRTLPAGKFKNICLKTLDDVARTRTEIVITKRGKPVAKLVPYVASPPRAALTGSIVRESGDPFSTGEEWDAGRS